MRNGRELIYIFASGYVCYLGVQIIISMQEEQPSNQIVLTLMAVFLIVAALALIAISIRRIIANNKEEKASAEQKVNEAQDVQEVQSTHEAPKALDSGKTEKMDVVKETQLSQDTEKMSIIEQKKIKKK